MARQTQPKATAGYSGTPLPKKLGFKEGSRIWAIDAPKGYRELVSPLPVSAKFVSSLTPDTDVVHVFATEKKALQKALKSLRPRIAQAAAVWASWPKKASGVPTDVTEDVIREVALPMGFVDIKVCAVDEVWSGVKLVIRKELRKG